MTPILAALLGVSVVWAAPTIDVRARTRLKIEEIARIPEGVRVRGWLLDAGSGGGVDKRALTVASEEQEIAVTTSPTGGFEVDLQVEPGAHTLAVAFPGDGLYGPASYPTTPFDVGKDTLSLRLDAPAEVDASDASARIVVEARSASGPRRVPVSLFVGEATQAAGRAMTGEDGIAQVALPRAALGGPGDKRLTARFAGDDAYNPAQTEATLRVVTTAEIRDLKAPSGSLRFEADFTVSGRLVDVDGPPVAHALISLSAGDRRLAQAASDDKGAFRLRAGAGELAPGPATLVVEYAPTTAWRRGARSAPFTVTILEPRPVPLRYTIGAFLFTVGAVLGFILLRTRPWLALARRFARWRQRRHPGDAPPEAPGEGDSPPATGLKPAKPSFLSTLRRPTDFGLSGRVRDVTTGDPVAHAQVLITPESPLAAAPVALSVDALGQFEVAELAAGAWRVEVSARGFVSERFPAALPHRGELRGARIDLLPVRERVFAIYRDVAARLLPSPRLWGVWTPREIFDHVRSQRPAGALGSLTDFVEEAYFSARSPDEDVLPVAEASARAAHIEQSRG